MRKLTALLFCFIFLLTPLLFANQIEAAKFSEAYMRLDRQKANTALSGVVCAKPSSGSAGTEAKVSIQFPSDFNLSTSTSNWTTSTSGIPSGSIAWPGIGSTATSVSGNTVIFNSGNLTSESNLYCFKYTAASSTTGDEGNKSGSITTMNSSNQTIDFVDYGLKIVPNDQVVVSATVPADSEDYEAEISKISTGNEFSEGNEIEYEISYGSSASTATDITLKAHWSLGTIEDQSSATVEVLEYVSGSASNAYNSTPPVIDLSNRTITWQINAFPGNTNNQTVRFKVKTTNNFSGTKKVSFTHQASILFPGGETVPSTITSFYKKSTGSSSSSTRSPSPTPIPKLTFNEIEIRNLTDTNSTLYFQTNQPASIEIFYGTNLQSLNKRVSSNRLLANQFINISGLTPDTKYYYRVIVKNSSGETLTSDIYTFTTAKSSKDIPVVNKNSFVVTSDDKVIFNPAILKEGESNKLIIPQGTIFNFTFALDSGVQAKRVQAIVRTSKGEKLSSKVLGVIDFPITSKALASTEIVDLIEIKPGVYSGKLKSLEVPGNYELYTRITDYNGNIVEQKLNDIKVINKLKVYSAKTKKPLEGVRLRTYIYNSTNKTYSFLSPQSYSLQNPAFTNFKGETDMILPVGRYKIIASNIGYKEKSVEFSIGENGDYPQIYLESTGITPYSFLRYHINSVKYIFGPKTVAYFDELSKSVRFFDLTATTVLGALVIFTFLAFAKKHHIPVSGVASYFYYMLDHKKRNENYVHGVVYSEKNVPVASANVYLTDKENEKIIGSTKTNKMGEFFFRSKPENKSILVMAKGFKNTPLLDYNPKEHLKFKVVLEGSHEGIHFIHNLTKIYTWILGISFETLAIITVIFEILFLMHFGFLKTAPFLIISVINLLLWTMFLRHR
jgi:hypothetical protein